MGVFNYSDTLELAAKKLYKMLWVPKTKPFTCPCCFQTVKLYNRSFDRSMAMFLKALVELYHYGDSKKPVHINQIKDYWQKRGYRIGSNGTAAIAYWGLANTYKSKNTKKNMSGMWVPTGKGIDFVAGRIKIESHVSTYNGLVQDRNIYNKLITINQVKGFDFKKLMNE